MVPRIDARTKEAFCGFERHPSNEAQVRRYTRDEMLRYRDLYSEPPYPGWDLRILLQAKLESAMVASGNTRGKDAVVPWSANRSLSEKEKLLKFVVGNLNRLTPEKYTDVMEVFCDPILLEKEDAIRITVHEIITKALHEPKYTAMYAQACFDIARFEILYSRQQINRAGGERRSRFRAELLKDVQLEFGRAITADIVIPVTGDGTTQFLSPHHEDTGVLFPVGVPPQSVPDGEEQERLKERAVANVRFIAELVHRKMISGKNCVAMLDMLLSGQPFPDERNIELACTLLFIIGPSMESDQSFFEWTAPFERISELSALMAQARTASKEMQDRSGQAPHYCPRIRFMMQDLLDMRSKNWAGKATWTGDHSEWTMQQILRKPEKPVARASSLSTTTAPPRLFAHTPYNKGSHQPASAQSQPRPSRTNGPLDLSSPSPKRAVSERMSNQSNTGDSMPPVEPEITLPLPQLSTTLTKQIHNCVQEIADGYGTEQSSRGLWMDPTVEQEIMHKIIEQILQQAEGHGNPQTDKMRDGDVSGNTRPVEGTGRELFFGSALASEGESVEASPCWDRDSLLQPQGATLVACLFATMIIAACKTTRTGWRNAAILALRSTCPGNIKALEVGFCWVYIQALEQDLVSDTPLFFARFFYMTQHVSESLPPVRVLMLLKRGLEYLEYRYPPSHDGIIDPAVIVSSRGGQDDSSTHHCGDADEYRPGAVMIEEFRLQARDLVKEYIKKYCSVPGSTSMLFTPLPATSRNVEPDKVKVVRADSNPPIRSGSEEQDKGNALSMISFLQDAAHVFGDSFECEISSLEVSAT